MIVWVALFMLLMLCFVALGIDVAKLNATRSQLQNAADAAALAGASAIDPASGVIDATSAVTRAQQTCSLNQAFVDREASVALDPADVVVGSHTCKVTVRREGANSIVTHFAQVLGIKTLEMAATATAKADTAHAVDCGILPLTAAPFSGQQFQYGQDYVLKDPDATGYGNGWYGEVQLPACLTSGPCAGMPASGAASYGCLLRYGYCCEVKVGETLNKQTGNMSGPNREGIRYRFEHDTVRDEGVSYADYAAAGGNGQRLVTVPITQDGGATVTVTGFANFFLKNVPGTGGNSVIIGEFVHATVPGVGNGGGAGPFVYTLRLIQ